MVDKRFAKLRGLVGEVPPPKLHGPKTADLTIVGWGSTKGAILTALRHLKEEGITANFLQLVTILPFPEKAVATALGSARQTLLVECNRTAQLGGVIREYTGIAITDHLLKYDGRPIYPEEVVQRAQEVLRG
jgi:2-oxoglutarate ferredoxin oxidoreductase subunit alpha